MPGLDYQLAFKHAPACLLVIGADAPAFTILDASDAYLAATLTRRDIAGCPMFEVFPDNPANTRADGVRNLGRSLARVLARRTRDVMPVQRYDVRDRSGAFVERHWTPVNAPALSSEGAVLAVVHRVEDVTEVVRQGEMLEGQAARIEHDFLVHIRALAAANRALHDTSAARDRLLAMVSHELRTPLSAIEAAAQVLASDLARRDAGTPGVFEILRTSIARMTRLVDDLHDYSAVQHGTFSIARSRENARDLCAAAVDQARIAHPRRNVEMEDGENILAAVDPVRFQQAITNLLTNALTHGARDAPVRVALARSRGFCVVTVSNDGDPIPESVVPTLFQAFRRGPRAASEDHLGLGLFIVRHIAEAHGGGVEVRSSPREGTRFILRVPCRS